MFDLRDRGTEIGMGEGRGREEGGEERQLERERERDRENINVRGKHRLVVFPMLLDWGSNLQPRYVP